MKIVVLSVIIIVIIVTIYLIAFQEKVKTIEVKDLNIRLVQESQNVYIDFDEDIAKLYYAENDLGNEFRVVDLDKNKLENYYEFIFNFSNDKLSRVETSTNENQPIYWQISITNQNNETINREGVDSYPKDWKEFIERTNKLIGEDYLTYDIHGLPLK